MGEERLKPYMGYVGDSRDGACLVFARTAREAKPLAWRAASGWCFTDWYPDVRVRLLRDSEHLYEAADPEKLARGEPHIVEEPPTCQDCGLWGPPVGESGYCEECEEANTVSQQVAAEGRSPACDAAETAAQLRGGAEDG